MAHLVRTLGEILTVTAFLFLVVFIASWFLPPHPIDDETKPPDVE